MGLKDKNNPLGQRIPSDRVGGPAPRMKHDQSADAVNEVKKRAAQLSKDSAKNKKEKTAAASGEYDTAGPERQPDKIMRQDRLGKEPRQLQDGQYTQDNEEEPDPV